MGPGNFAFVTMAELEALDDDDDNDDEACKWVDAEPLPHQGAQRSEVHRFDWAAVASLQRHKRGAVLRFRAGSMFVVAARVLDAPRWAAIDAWSTWHRSAIGSEPLNTGTRWRRTLLWMAVLFFFVVVYQLLEP